MFRKCVLENFQNEFKIGFISGKMPEKVNALIKPTPPSFAVVNFFRNIYLLSGSGLHKRERMEQVI